MTLKILKNLCHRHDIVIEDDKDSLKSLKSSVLDDDFKDFKESLSSS